jgi:hypothetical protein
MTHTFESLSVLYLSQIKEIASELDLMPEGDKRAKQTWIDAILANQSQELENYLESQVVISHQYNTRPTQVGDRYDIDGTTLICVAAETPDYAAIWDVHLDGDNVGFVQMDYHLRWTNNMSFGSDSFGSVQEARANLLEHILSVENPAVLAELELKEAQAKARTASLHERSLLMAIAETESSLGIPSVGEEIHYFWKYRADASCSEDYDLSGFVDELTQKFDISDSQAYQAIEAVRQIILEYDKLLSLPITV